MPSRLVEDSELRALVLEVLSSKTTGEWNGIRREVIQRVQTSNLGSLGPNAEQHLNQLIIGLIVEQLVTLGAKDGNYSPSWPPIILTDLGRAWVNTTGIRSLDSDGYARLLRDAAPGAEPATIEYAIEAFKCLQQNLLFAGAVMIGAAAEGELFRLGRAIVSSAEPQQSVSRLTDALDRGRLPSLFQEIRSWVDQTIREGVLPYSVHQSSIEHLLSFQEMIRAQRNEAVHSGVERISKMKVFLSIQTFPAALGVVDRLRAWFEERRAD